MDRFSHTLSKWHRELNDAYGKIAERFDLSDDECADFANHYEKTRMGMEAFERLDKGSYNFRFPIERKTGKLIWSHDDTVDLLGLKNLFDEAMILLRHTIDALALTESF